MGLGLGAEPWGKCGKGEGGLILGTGGCTGGSHLQKVHGWATPWHFRGINPTKTSRLVVQVMVCGFWAMRHLAGTCQDGEISGRWEFQGTEKVKFSFGAVSLGSV